MTAGHEAATTGSTRHRLSAGGAGVVGKTPVQEFPKTTLV